MRGRRLVAVGLGAGALLLAAPSAAQAHPLGNFTVNHYDHLQLTPTQATLLSVVDRAEIPAAQALQTIAPDGSPTDEQLAAAAAVECADLRDAVQLRVDGDRVAWTAGDATMESVPGAAGLPTLRLTCTATADADLDGESTVELRDEHLTDRVGWREMTADGDGVRLVDSPVPTQSITDELRTYPEDLLASPVDVRSFTAQTEPGTNSGGGASVSPTSGDPFTSAMLALDRRLEDMIGDRELTPLVGTLAVLLAVLLGCGHALLPGHGKTVMAAYLAGRAGRPRDAVVVGATVTATHTVGVLALGLALSISSSLAGDQVIRWLGVVSGLLVAGIGLAMLRTALPRWRAARAARSASPAAQRTPALAGALVAAPAHTHGPGHAHDDGHDHPHGDHDHPHPHGDHDHPHGDHDLPHGDHDHPHGDHDHGDHTHSHDDHAHDGHTHEHADHEHGHEHPHEHDHPHGEHDHEHDHGGKDSWWSGGHSHGPGGHTHGPGGHIHGPGRSGLIGMGIAGGLVPSPSALIVLLASIGLGRTVFGVLLVLAYGIGMAGTLTAVGLLLVRLRGRLDRRVAGLRRDRVVARVARAMPVVTASLVLLVGVTLVARGVLLA